MDYTAQIEKLFKYFDLSLEFENKVIITKLKQNFNNDLNLFGCFIKDYLTIKCPNKEIEDINIYSEFVIFFENIKIQEKNNELFEFFNYGNYYLTIVFENTNEINLQSTIGVVNSCFALDCYPYLMILQNKLNKKEINKNSYILMLKSISDAVLERFKHPENSNIEFKNLKIANEIINLKERLVS